MDSRNILQRYEFPPLLQLLHFLQQLLVLFLALLRFLPRLHQDLLFVHIQLLNFVGLLVNKSNQGVFLHAGQLFSGFLAQALTHFFYQLILF